MKDNKKKIIFATIIILLIIVVAILVSCNKENNNNVQSEDDSSTIDINTEKQPEDAIDENPKESIPTITNPELDVIENSQATE